MMKSVILLTVALASIPFSLAQQRVSTSARCGIDFGGRTCKGSTFGNCCSQYSWCGSTTDYCGNGCKPGYGDCKQSSQPFSVSRFETSSSRLVSSSARTSSAKPSPTGQISTDARCGKAGSGRTCKSSKWGDCCSQYDYCGSTNAYCGKGCQSAFGTCNGDQVSSSKVRSSSRTSSLVASSLAIVSSSSSASSAPAVSSTPTSSSADSSSVASSSIALSSDIASSTPSPSPSSVVSSSSVSVSAIFPTSSIVPSDIAISTPVSTISSSSSDIVPSSTIASSVAPTPTGTRCPEIGATYTTSNGQTYNVNCNGFYPIRGGGLVGTSNQPSLAGCIEFCSTQPGCIVVDYDVGSGLCDAANSNVNGLVTGFQSARLVGT